MQSIWSWFDLLHWVVVQPSPHVGGEKSCTYLLGGKLPILASSQGMRLAMVDKSGDGTPLMQMIIASGVARMHRYRHV